MRNPDYVRYTAREKSRLHEIYSKREIHITWDIQLERKSSHNTGKARRESWEIHRCQTKRKTLTQEAEISFLLFFFLLFLNKRAGRLNISFYRNFAPSACIGQHHPYIYLWNVTDIFFTNNNHHATT